MTFDIRDPRSEASVAWSRNHFRILNEGGVWGIPRSGLMFRKQDGKLVCFLRMPHQPEMLEHDPPITPEQVKEQQDRDFDDVKTSFGLAGITVEDQSNG